MWEGSVFCVFAPGWCFANRTYNVCTILLCQPQLDSTFLAVVVAFIWIRVDTNSVTRVNSLAKFEGFMQEINPKILQSYYSNLWSWTCQSNSKSLFSQSWARVGVANLQIHINPNMNTIQLWVDSRVISKNDWITSDLKSKILNWDSCKTFNKTSNIIHRH